MIRTRLFRLVLLLTLGLATALLGCGSSDGGAGGSGDAGGSGGTGGSNGAALRILVTNDDGVGAPGIDAIVEALRADPRNEIIVSAPAENKSGSGDRTTPTPPPLETMMTTTASGYPATAVVGLPADAVVYALANLYPDGPPDLVLSGINNGQNVGNVKGLLSQVSGTVGAAKTAACADVPALASSQGSGETVDFPAGVDAVLAWLDANRAALLAGDVPVQNITSINVPSCDGKGSIRGTVEVPLATMAPDYVMSPIFGDPQDCESIRESPSNDMEAFFNGFVAVTPVPRATTCPNK